MIVAHAQDLNELIFNINYSYHFILYPEELYILEGADNRSQVPIIEAKIRLYLNSILCLYKFLTSYIFF